MYHFHIKENTACSLEERDKKALLANLFYAVSGDYEMLVTATFNLCSLLPEELRIEDKIRAFSIFGEANCVPTYEQLCLKTLAGIEECFRQ